MLKYNRNTLQRIERLLEDQEFIIRYEKGNFKSGYCLVENKKVIVINKYFDVQARITCFLDIVSQIDIRPGLFSESSKRYFNKLASTLESGIQPLVQTSISF